MSSTAPFEPIADMIERTLSIRHVYGEPIHQGETTVIPVARVAYGFGAGGGWAHKRGPKRISGESASGEDNLPKAQGGGGGGGVRMMPVGALEISPRGTRFIRYRPLTPLLGAAAFGLVVGWLLARSRS